MSEVLKAGPVIYVILFFSVLGLTAIIERLYYLLVIERGNYEDIKTKIKSLVEKNDISGAKELCLKDGRAIGKVLYVIIDNIGEEKNELDERVREVMLSQVPTLEKYMWLINLTGYIAPLLGLLGTVTGMITSFAAISSNGVTKENVAGGIYEALMSTATGLMVAIPAIIFYSFLNKKIDVIINELERSAVEFINALGRR